jgi:hypothetical protein
MLAFCHGPGGLGSSSELLILSCALPGCRVLDRNGVGTNDPLPVMFAVLYPYPFNPIWVRLVNSVPKPISQYDLAHFGVPLRTRPSPVEQGWRMATMDVTGSDFDAFSVSFPEAVEREFAAAYGDERWANIKHRLALPYVASVWIVSELRAHLWPTCAF